MARPARRPEGRAGGGTGAVRRRAAAPPEPSVLTHAAEFAMRNPRALGGGTAFLVALSFVSANAIWYQPHRHTGAFFATRPAPVMPEPEPVSARPAPAGDPTLMRAQAALKTLGVYSGPVDGLPGPGTRKAILSFQQANGIAPSGELDGGVIAALVDRTTVTQTIPATRPMQEADASTSMPAPSEHERIMKVQAGLKAFGNDGIAVDGLMGARTEAGIREFQSLFGLPENGKPDDALYAKMKEVGLTN